jgi:hypothetical protein
LYHVTICIEISSMKFYIPLVVTLLCVLLTHSLVYASDSQPEDDTETTDLPAETDSDTPGGNKKFKFLSKKPENLLLVPIPTHDKENHTRTYINIPSLI